MSNALYVEHEAAGFRLTGWLCQPTYARAQPDLQHFYLNGRMLRDRLVSSAIRLGYRDVMFHGRHPAFVLFLEVDPRQVDVNAHPAKLEVRFRDGRHVHDFLFRSVERALRETYAGSAGAPPPASVESLLPGTMSGPGAAVWPHASPGSDYRFAQRAAGAQSHLGLRVADLRARSAVRWLLRCNSARNAAARLRACAIAWDLHPCAGAGWLDSRRHACGARADDLRADEGGARSAERSQASPCSFLSCSLSRLQKRTCSKSTQRPSADWRSMSCARVRRAYRSARLPAFLLRTDCSMSSFSASARDLAAAGATRSVARSGQRSARDDGLSRRGARASQSHSAGNERVACARWSAPCAAISAITGVRPGRTSVSATSIACFFADDERFARPERCDADPADHGADAAPARPISRFVWRSASRSKS